MTTTSTKYRRYAKYKPSGIDWLGDIPEGWEVKRLKYLSDTRVSNVDKKSEDEVSVRLCNYVDVYYNEFINGKLDFMVATATSDQVDKFELKQGDVIITKDSETPDDIGIPAYVDFENTKNVVCGYHLAISTPIKSLLLGKYLFRLFQSNMYRAYFEVSSNGVTRYGLDTYSIFNADIPLPNLPEQRAIADFLDRETARIDGVVAKKTKLIELLKEKRQALITHAATKGLDPKAKMKPSGIDWLGDIPEGWELWKVAHLFRKIGSGTTPPSENTDYYDGDIPWVKTGELNDGEISDTEDKVTHKATLELSALKIFPKDSLLIAMYGATIGKMAILQIPATTNQACCVLGDSKITNTKFAYYYLLAFRPHLIALSYGGGQPNISQDTVRSVRINLPPFNEQRTIADFLDRETAKIDEVMKKVESQIEKLKEYRQALITSAVTGKIMVN